MTKLTINAVSAIIGDDKTRQGYARKRILKVAGYFFWRCHE